MSHWHRNYPPLHQTTVDHPQVDGIASKNSSDGRQGEDYPYKWTCWIEVKGNLAIKAEYRYRQRTCQNSVGLYNPNQ
jgi:hypothetical protein